MIPSVCAEKCHNVTEPTPNQESSNPVPSNPPTNPGYPQAPFSGYPPYPYSGFPGIPYPLTPRIFHRATSLGNDPTHSELAEADQIPSLYPRITHWLQELDMGPCGADAQNFRQYGPSLEANGYSRISQIADEGKTESGACDLIGICKGLKLGVAKLLIKYAKADCEDIEKRELACHQSAPNLYD